METRIFSSYDEFTYKKETLNESSTTPGKMFLSGILQRANTVNQNGRIYPKEILEREVRNYQKFIVENRALGELDHPSDSIVNLRNVSHIIREAHMEGDVVFGKLEVLTTPSGKILQSLIETGVKLGISSRGLGSTKKQGDYHIVQEDFQLICFDMVSEPSTPEAFMLKEGKIISENDKKRIFTKSDRIDRIANQILDMYNYSDINTIRRK
jgi:hypothetical protein